MPDDLSSLAWSLIPAAVGAAAGGPAYGAYGLATGVANQEDTKLQLQKANADIQFKNIENQRAQQQLDFQNRHWQKVEQNIDSEMKTADQERTQKAWAFQNAQRDDASSQAYGNAIKDPGLRSLYFADPKHTEYWEKVKNYFTDDASVKVAASALSAMNLPKGVDPMEYARRMGVDGVKDWIKQGQEHQNRMQEIAAHGANTLAAAGLNRYAATMAADGSGFFLTDHRDGSMKFRSNEDIGAGGVGMKAADRLKAIDSMKAQYAVEKKDNPQIGEFDDWIRQPTKQVETAFRLHELNPDEYKAEMEAAQRFTTQKEQAGLRGMQEKWGEIHGEKIDPRTGTFAPAAQAQWEKYLTDDSGNGPTYLRGWINWQKKHGGQFQMPPSSAPSRSAPAGQGAAGMDLPPPAKEHAGRTIRDTKSGKLFKSDGTMWVPQ